MKKKLCVVTLVMATLLTGCTSVPDLSHVDNNLAAQYVADALLRNDKNYDDSLDYDHSILRATPTPRPTPIPTPVPSPDASTDSPSSGSTVGDKLESVSLSDIYGISGVTIKANTYRTTASYGTDYAVCTPKNGNKLVVVNFSVKNSSKAAKKVNLAKKNIKAELLSGGNSLGSPMLSIVDGDLQFFNAKIDGGKTKQGVLIFEVSKSAKLNNVEVRFVKNNKEAIASVR